MDSDDEDVQEPLLDSSGIPHDYRQFTEVGVTASDGSSNQQQQAPICKLSVVSHLNIIGDNEYELSKASTFEEIKEELQKTVLEIRITDEKLQQLNQEVRNKKRNHTIADIINKLTTAVTYFTGFCIVIVPSKTAIDTQENIADTAVSFFFSLGAFATTLIANKGSDTITKNLKSEIDFLAQSIQDTRTEIQDLNAKKESLTQVQLDCLHDKGLTVCEDPNGDIRLAVPEIIVDDPHEGYVTGEAVPTDQTTAREQQGGRAPRV